MFTGRSPVARGRETGNDGIDSQSDNYWPCSIGKKDISRKPYFFIQQPEPMETVLLFLILAMAFRRCRSCRESPIRLRWKTRRHIIDEHFCRENVDTCSTFYRDISFRMVFERFKAQFREGTLEKEDPRSSRNLVYFCLFNRVVGSSPSPDGRKRLRSRHVRVPCVRSTCRNCSHPVIVIKTFFPDGQRRPIY